MKLINEGKDDEVERLLNLALGKMTPYGQEDMVTIYENPGLLHEYKGENSKAIVYYKKALTISNNNDSKYYAISGKINILEGNVNNSIANFEKSVEINPNDFDALNNLGLIYLGVLDDNIQDFEKALEHNKKAYLINNNIVSMENRNNLVL